ncbi:unnamed protein product [Ectocarpus sp. CCAP 1310/34]|nr:unnamed protein product [Ectocarpus sp. CCAP 1310/34]
MCSEFRIVSRDCCSCASVFVMRPGALSLPLLVSTRTSNKTTSPSLHIVNRDSRAYPAALGLVRETHNMSTKGPGNFGGGEAGPTHAELRTAIDDAVGDASTRLEKMVTEKMEGIMDTLPRLVPGAPPAGSATAAGGGGESLGRTHAFPGAGQLDQASNTERGLEGARGLRGPEPREPSPPEGAYSREGVSREEQASRYAFSSHARMSRLKQLDFDGDKKNWLMFRNDFITQVQTCGMGRALSDKRDIVVLGVDDDGMVEQGVEVGEIAMYRNLWGMLTGAISNISTKMLVYDRKGPSAAWRGLEETFTPSTRGEQISLIGKFYNAQQGKNQDPRVFFQEFQSVVTNLELAFDQRIHTMLVYARFLDALSPEFEIQKQQLLTQKTLDEKEILRVLRTRAWQLKAEEKKGKSDRRANHHAFVAVEGKGGGKKRSKQNRGDEEANSASDKQVKCYVCDGDHYASACPEKLC